MLHAFVLTTLLLTVPDLTHIQREKVEATSSVKESFEEPGFYALLENTAWWKAGDEAGAMIPDYKAIHEDQIAHRGKLYLIEGIFPGTPEKKLPGMDKPEQTLRVPPTVKDGPWNETLEQWPIIVDR